MNNYLFFDTETTTFPNPNFRPTHPRQARICQLAAVLTNDKFEEIEVIAEYIKPAGWEIQEGAFKAHGISMETCREKGVDIELVLSRFLVLSTKAQSSVAHNRLFDDNMMEIELACHHEKDKSIVDLPLTDHWDNHIKYCTMELTTPICKLSHKNGKKRLYGQDYKWPKLQEAHLHFFGAEFESAHDALADVRATIKIFKHIVENGLVPSMKLPSNIITLSIKETAGTLHAIE